jgi:hypothetical protein
MGWQDDQVIDEPATADWQHDEVVPSDKPAPSMLAVAGNAVAKGVAGTIDMFGNAPTNAFNLGQGVIGAAGEALGHPEVWADRTFGTPPNIGHKALTAAGLIRPENEPQGAGQRVLDTGIQAGVGMLANPVKGIGQAAANIAQGITAGTLAQITKEATGSDLLALAVGVVTPFALSRAYAPGTKSMQTPVGTATLKDAHEAGYVVQPSTVKPSMGTNKIESVAGKAAVAQDAALRNQAVTNKLAAKSIGLPEETSLTMSAIEEVRTKAAKPYQEIEALTQHPQQTPGVPSFPQYFKGRPLDELKQARADASAFYRHYDRSADPASLKTAQQASAKAQAIETQLEKFAASMGKPELVDQLKAARQLYARTYDVERALNLADGNVSASLIGRMYDKGRPLSGELKVIGKFAQAFPRVARDASSLPPPSVSGTDAASSAILGGIGYAAAGGPAGLLAAGLPLLRSPARNLVLSGVYQSRLLRDAAPLSPSLVKGALVGKSLHDYQEAVQ